VCPRASLNMLKKGPITCHLPKMSYPAHNPVNVQAAIPDP